MKGYCCGYGCYPLIIEHYPKSRSQEGPPSTVTMATPQPNPPTVPGIMLAVSSSSWTTAAPTVETPKMVTFLGPQPEPPDMAIKRYQDYLSMLKVKAKGRKQSADDASRRVMLAVPDPSWTIRTPMVIPSNMPIFLSPKLETPDRAFRRYMDYLEELKNWADQYTTCLDDAHHMVDGFVRNFKEL